MELERPKEADGRTGLRRTRGKRESRNSRGKDRGGERGIRSGKNGGGKKGKREGGSREVIERWKG